MLTYEIESFIEIGKPIETVGTSWGHDGLVLIYREEAYGIARVRGHLSFAGMGRRRYFETRYLLVRFVEEAGYLGRGSKHWMDVLADARPGHAWQAEIEKFKADIAKMISEAS